MQPADHGSQYSSLSTSEASGYARAMLDCIDWLTYHAAHEADQARLEGLSLATHMLVAYRNAKLSAPMQPMLQQGADTPGTRRQTGVSLEVGADGVTRLVGTFAAAAPQDSRDASEPKES